MSNRFIAGDWGTTQLRLWLCEGHRVLDTLTGVGIGKLQQSPAEHFSSLIAPWRAADDVRIALLCGMVGSRNGWQEAAYVRCPATSDELRRAFAHVSDAGIEIAIVPGLSCTNPAGAPDVMRGEETQLIGAATLRPEFATGEHVFALPGTHTKWARMVDGRVTAFQTALTGELFALLRGSTLLRASRADGEQPEDTAFDHGVTQARSARGGLLHALFQTRSRQLIDSMGASAAKSFLSGLLIGSDVQGALDTFATGARVILIGEPLLSSYYARALQVAGVASVSLDGAQCVLAGLRTLIDH